MKIYVLTIAAAALWQKLQSNLDETFQPEDRQQFFDDITNGTNLGDTDSPHDVIVVTVDADGVGLETGVQASLTGDFTTVNDEAGLEQMMNEVNETVAASAEGEEVEASTDDQEAGSEESPARVIVVDTSNTGTVTALSNNLRENYELDDDMNADLANAANGNTGDNNCVVVTVWNDGSISVSLGIKDSLAEGYETIENEADVDNVMVAAEAETATDNTAAEETAAEVAAEEPATVSAEDDSQKQ